MKLLLEVQNNEVFEKLKWLLMHFINDGVIIEEIVDDDEMEEILNDKELTNSLKRGLEEVKKGEYEIQDC